MGKELGTGSKGIPITTGLSSQASLERTMDASNIEKPLAETQGPIVNELPANGPSSPSLVPEDNLSRWNEPRINISRTLAACFGFIIMGMNDAAYGALIPYVRSQYPTPSSLPQLSPSPSSRLTTTSPTPKSPLFSSLPSSAT